MMSWTRRPRSAWASSLRPVQPADDRLEADPAAGVRLRIEEDLGVYDVLGAGLAEVGHGQVVEVLLDQQHGHALVVPDQERRQVGEGVRGPHRLHGGIRQVDVVARGEVELELGLQGALDVQMQFGLWHAIDKGPDIAHRAVRPSNSSWVIWCRPARRASG